MTKPETVICTYKVKPGREAEMQRLLARHWPTLRRLGLVTSEPSKFFRGAQKDNGSTFVEIFTWLDGRSPEVAHHNAEVMSIWEPMGALCEEMTFPHFEPWTVELAP